MLLKFNSSGQLIFTRQVGSFADDVGNSVSVDGAGNILVAGSTSGSVNGEPFFGGLSDIVVFKFSPDGTLLQTKVTGTTGDDYGYGIIALIIYIDFCYYWYRC